MKVFKKSKPLIQIIRELAIGETIKIDNRQAKTATVRKMVTALRKYGYEYQATEKGLINEIAVTKIRDGVKK